MTTQIYPIIDMTTQIHPKILEKCNDEAIELYKKIHAKKDMCNNLKKEISKIRNKIDNIEKIEINPLLAEIKKICSHQVYITEHYDEGYSLRRRYLCCICKETIFPSSTAECIGESPLF